MNKLVILYKLGVDIGSFKIHHSIIINANETYVLPRCQSSFLMFTADVRYWNGIMMAATSSGKFEIIFKSTGQSWDDKVTFSYDANHAEIYIQNNTNHTVNMNLMKFES